MAGQTDDRSTHDLEAAFAGEHERFSLPPTVVIRDLAPDDVASLSWALGDNRAQVLLDNLHRMRSGEIVYLVAAIPGEAVVGHLGVDLSRRSLRSASYLWQFGVRDDLQSRGIGTRMLGVAERLTSGRGLEAAQIAVAKDNDRARDLYERLGYVVIGSEIGRWVTVRNGREIEVVEDEWMLRKELT